MCKSEASSAASADSTLGSNGKDSKPSGSARTTSSAKKYSDNTGPGSPFITTSPRWTERDAPRLTYSSEASHAKTSATLDVAQALRKALALGCGSTTQDSLMKYDQDGSSSRTSQDSLETAWTSYWVTLNASVIKRSSRFFLKLPQSGHLIRGKESLWLPTPSTFDHQGTLKNSGGNVKQWGGINSIGGMAETGMWPTPNCADTFTNNLKSSQQKPGSLHSVTLAQKVMWPTPKSTEHKSSDRMMRGNLTLKGAVKIWPTPRKNMHKDAHGVKGKSYDANLGEKVGGQLNPHWVEWLMGFPIGWTNLKDSAMQSSRNARRSSRKPSGS